MSIQFARDYVAHHEAKGHHVDSRVKRLLASGNLVTVESIGNSDQFLRLLYHDNQKVSGFLTPYHEPRTLRDVVGRMKERSLDLTTISQSDPSISEGLHDPKWFEKCSTIFQAQLSYTDFGSLFLMDLTDEEKRWSPQAISSIFDGTHRSLVLAWLLIHELIDFQPIRCFIFRPRPPGI